VKISPMICLRCGYCCFHYAVVIVDDPDKGPVEHNMKCKIEPGERCQHLLGDTPGEYSCAIHDREWYPDTPCFHYGQIERSLDTECRMGKYILEKRRENQG